MVAAHAADKEGAVASTAGQIRYEDLAPKERRRLLLRHLLRVALT